MVDLLIFGLMDFSSRRQEQVTCWLVVMADWGMKQNKHPTLPPHVPSWPVCWLH